MSRQVIDAYEDPTARVAATLCALNPKKGLYEIVFQVCEENVPVNIDMEDDAARQ